ncbi:YagK/YfjJ domain-containing protein [Arenibaculum sp.]|jgi:hypothetical protein|uniref:YagK/YfjJ domain-containing protein n=1 Tax=Arenibaculum sp. TaxID=2865862 RepID=UPI003BB8F499
MLERHNKVLVIRFDVRFPSGYAHDGKNAELSIFIRRLGEILLYWGIDSQYVWVREQVSSGVPHYHFVLMVDGSKVQNPRGILNDAERIWSALTGVAPGGLIDHCRHVYSGTQTPGHVMVRRPPKATTGDPEAHWREYERSRSDALALGSYLAKPQGKGMAPPRVREFGASLL